MSSTTATKPAESGQAEPHTPVAPVFDGVDELPWSVVYDLRTFYFDNVKYSITPRPDRAVPVPVDGETLRRLIRFAGAHIGNGDPTVPRHLEALRVLQLVPEKYGEALFAEPAQH